LAQQLTVVLLIVLVFELNNFFLFFLRLNRRSEQSTSYAFYHCWFFI